jgi:hypothetical protein
MSLINVSLNLVCYADALKTVNPSVKFTDLKWSMLGMPTDSPQMVPVTLSPGETKAIMSVTRSISFNGATSFSIAQVPGSSDVQLQASLEQRTGRLDGDGTTEWQIIKTNSIIQAKFSGTGTAPTFASIQIGDGVTLGSPFNTFNQGDFVIVNKGSDYIEFVNPIGMAETVVGQVDVYSSGPVQVGDVLDISNSNFSFPNQGQFKITRVTDEFVQFSNPAAIEETISGITTGVVIYPEAIKWMLLAIDHVVSAQFNGDSGSGVVIEPPVNGDLAGNPGILLKRGKIYQLNLFNPGINVATGFVFFAE